MLGEMSCVRRRPRAVDAVLVKLSTILASTAPSYNHGVKPDDLPQRQPRRRRAAPVQRREELLQIATGVFAEKGYANATVRDIADSAGILSGSLYYHFESKDALLAEILASALGGVADRYEAAAREPAGGRAALEALVRVGLAFVDEHRAVAKIIQNDVPYLRRATNFEFLNEINDRIHRVWVEVLEAGVRDGAFRRGLDVGLAYRTVMGTIMSTARWSSAERARNAHEALVRLMLMGVGRRAA
jgi:AcrR family transcriptional regulator